VVDTQGTTGTQGELSRPVVRVLDILEALAARTQPVPTSILAVECHIPKSTIHVILNTLQSRRFVAYHGAKQGWMLGPRIGELTREAPLLLHGLAVLDTFRTSGGEQTPTQVARSSDLPLPVARRTLALLAEQGMLEKVDSERFSLGLQIVSLASNIRWLDRLRTAAHPILIRLRDATMETANLVVRDGHHALYVDQVESRYSLRHSGWAGQRIPLSCTATGRAMDNPGIAVAVTDAIEAGVTAIACALPKGEKQTALSITAPTFRMTSAAIRNACSMLERAAAELAAKA